MKKLKIGVLGSRGIPNHYGGFEQCAEFLSLALLKKGHDVSVYNSSQHAYQSKTWKGVKIIHCEDPEDRFKTFGQFIYDFNCIRNARKQKFDITLHLGYTSSAIWFPFLAKDSHHIINMDGLEWKRDKYSLLIKKFLNFSETLAMRFFDSHVADAIAIKDYLENKHQKKLTYIPYGAEYPVKTSSVNLLNKKFKKGHYDLIICRMEPENHVGLIIQGHLEAKIELPLVIIGNTTNEYGSYLKEKYASDNVVFLEGIYQSEELETIRSSCRIYYHGHSVGGTNPSLLDAIASGCLICAHDNGFNREVLNNNHLYFKGKSDFIKLKLLKKSDYKNDIQRSIDTLLVKYNWENVSNLYEQLFYECVGESNIEQTD